MNPSKVCSKCKIEKELTEFNFRDKSKGTYRGDCKSCQSNQRKQFYKANYDRISEKSKKYYDDNREKIKEKNKRYYENNVQRIINNSKNRYRNNIEKMREQHRKYFQTKNGRQAVYKGYLKRRSRKHKVHFTSHERFELLERDNWICQCCGTWVHDDSKGDWNNPHKAHVDHIIPISKGGTSDLNNLQILCRTCNLSKSNKLQRKGVLM